MSRKKLTAQEMARRRLGRKNVINAVSCPKCGAAIGMPCQAVRYLERYSPHIERIRVASSLNHGE